MSQENVDALLAAVDAVNRQDPDAFVAYASPDIEWEDSVFWSETARTYRGREQLRDWFREQRRRDQTPDVGRQLVLQRKDHTTPSLPPPRRRPRSRRAAGVGDYLPRRGGSALRSQVPGG
jgi:SnoaL-like domain